jgi:peptidyl-prolyl cis-trans isomerase B (cyclophilin B)
MRKLVLTLVAIAALSISGCGGGSDKPAAATTDAHGCKTAQKPEPKTVKLSAPTEKLDPSQTYVATFMTNCGAFQITLDPKHNPLTSASFAQLVNKGVYNDTWFHRIVANFVLQGGDPSGSGGGDAGYNVVEPPTGKYKIGTVAMAKTATAPSGASSSQFYIVIGSDGTDLPPDYAIAGRVTSGQKTIDKLATYAEPVDPQTAMPVDVALIEKATLAAKN